MSDRAASSVLDVTVCLLLVSASAAALTHAPVPPEREGPDRADSVLGVVTTTTAWVEYATTESEPNRTAHGTLAGLLADGAAANATVHGEPGASGTADFRRAVAEAVRRATARIDVRVQVVARCRPGSPSNVRGRFAVGPSPPQTADVHAASTVVPRNSSTGSERAGEVRLVVRTWSP